VHVKFQFTLRKLQPKKVAYLSKHELILRTVARKFSIWGLCVSVGVFAFVRGALTF